MICDVCKSCVEGAWGSTSQKVVTSVEHFLKHNSLLRSDGLHLDRDGPLSVYVHHENQASYEKSYDQGCALCRAWGFPTRLERRPEFMELDCFSVLYIGFEDDGAQKVPVMHVENEHNHQVFTLVPAQEGDHELGVHHALGPATDHPFTWQIMDKWMNICTKSHAHCQNPSVQSTFRPERLLKIESESTFRIVNTTDAIHDLLSNSTPPEPGWSPDIPYAVLTYCWDDLPWNRALRATSSNIDTFTTSRPVTDLPKTYRDAVRVAHHFGYEFLWIDRLCDLWGGEPELCEPDGWPETSARLGRRDISNIFRSASLGIVALGAPGQDGGLFLERDVEKQVATVLKMQLTSDGPFETFRAEQEFADKSIRDFLADPVHRAPWIEQERLLPPRTLYFGSKEVYWECRAAACCEKVPHGIYSSAFMGPEKPSETFAGLEDYVVVGVNDEDSASVEDVDALSDIEEASMRGLPNASDKVIDGRVLRKRSIHKLLLYFAERKEQQDYFDWKAMLEMMAMKRWLFHCCSKVPKKFAMKPMEGKDMNMVSGI